MIRVSRRDFLRTTTTAAGALIAGGSLTPVKAGKQSATDWVTLGNSGIKVTRLAFGTGTMGGRVQRELGQEKFGSAQESDKTPGFIGFLVGATSQSANRLIGWECAESLSGRALKWDLHAGQMAKQQSGPRLGEQWVRHVAAG